MSQSKKEQGPTIKSDEVTDTGDAASAELRESDLKSISGGVAANPGPRDVATGIASGKRQ